MRTLWLLLISSILMMPVAAKEVALPLSDHAIAGLKGKTLALARPFKRDILATTPFPIESGSPLVTILDAIERTAQDPADIVSQHLLNALVDQYGVNVLPERALASGSGKLEKILQTQTPADLILDVRTAGWEFQYYRRLNNTYTVNYSIMVKLVDMKSDQLLSNMACNAQANTHRAVYQPSLNDLLANNGKLFKELSAQLGWTCAHILAKTQFRFDQEKLPATPDRFIDPLLVFRDRFLLQQDADIEKTDPEVDATQK